MKIKSEAEAMRSVLFALYQDDGVWNARAREHYLEGRMPPPLDRQFIRSLEPSEICVGDNWTDLGRRASLRGHLGREGIEAHDTRYGLGYYQTFGEWNPQAQIDWEKGLMPPDVAEIYFQHLEAMELTDVEPNHWMVVGERLRAALAHFGGGTLSSSVRKDGTMETFTLGLGSAFINGFLDSLSIQRGLHRSEIMENETERTERAKAELAALVENYRNVVRDCALPTRTESGVDYVAGFAEGPFQQLHAALTVALSLVADPERMLLGAGSLAEYRERCDDLRNLSDASREAAKAFRSGTFACPPEERELLHRHVSVLAEPLRAIAAGLEKARTRALDSEDALAQQQESSDEF